MTGEERWRAAIAEEERHPTHWSPDMNALRAALADRLATTGCEWPLIAACSLHARAEAAIDREAFAGRLGLTAAQLQTLEGG